MSLSVQIHSPGMDVRHFMKLLVYYSGGDDMVVTPAAVRFLLL